MKRVLARGRARTRLARWAAVAILAALGVSPASAAPTRQRAHKKRFVNPVLGAGQDPSVVTHDGWYYYTQSSPDTTYITIRRSRSIKSLAAAPRIVVWRGRWAGSPCCQWWAPELHEIDGRWYIYAAADDGSNAGHRLEVLASGRPLGPYRYLGQLTTPGNFWSIDPSPLRLRDGRLLLFWSGWPAQSGQTQNIYVAAMSNAWTLTGDRVELSSPTYGWERQSRGLGVDVNESPEPVIHGSTVSVTYSASGCWTPDYSIGLLSAHVGANLLSPASWRKSRWPLFQSNRAAGIWGPASNGWFTSPNGAQTWFVFNAVRNPNGNCGNERQVYAERVHWSANGTPRLGGKPLPLRHRLRVPAGDPGGA
jgi:GH43 family beta-xylosidase